MAETTVKVTLGKFACAGIRDKIGPDIQAGARTALTHYVLKLKLGRPPVDVPKRLPNGVSEPEMSFDLTIDEDTHRLLAAEAERQGTTVVAIAGHSVFLYLAELDLLSGSFSQHGQA